MFDHYLSNFRQESNQTEVPLAPSKPPWCRDAQSPFRAEVDSNADFPLCQIVIGSQTN